jgi:hypothetical protein
VSALFVAADAGGAIGGHDPDPLERTACVAATSVVAFGGCAGGPAATPTATNPANPNATPHDPVHLLRIMSASTRTAVAGGQGWRAFGNDVGHPPVRLATLDETPVGGTSVVPATAWGSGDSGTGFGKMKSAHFSRESRL